ncbi:copper chaperone for superoxide dismutase [Elysia marginata]|uniref:Superoxide dismutase copper chaperone n=1 Tax=Elysia marginata TaxID=1093978 RepID=A0AAV4EKD2_9GAST|nr:copper chaperone for superoxide dismutase [Elysia marginata]
MTSVSEADGQNPVTKMEFAVEMKSPCCGSKVENALNKLPGIKSIKVNPSSQRLVVEGNVAAEAVRSQIEDTTGMSTVLLGYGSSGANLGAGVAAISIGSSKVQGLLRFVQSNPNTCIIEGTVDELPTSESIYLSVHETGDVSDGCESCGPPLSQEGCQSGGILSSFLSMSNRQFGGILGQLHPSEDKRAEFRIASAVNLSDMYGHCVVIHKGSKEDVEQGKSKRLACGIIARASGLFQNSKRFCACDGVSIWEQRDMDKNSSAL